MSMTHVFVISLCRSCSAILFCTLRLLLPFGLELLLKLYKAPRPPLKDVRVSTPLPKAGRETNCINPSKRLVLAAAVHAKPRGCTRKRHCVHLCVFMLKEAISENRRKHNRVQNRVANVSFRMLVRCVFFRRPCLELLKNLLLLNMFHVSGVLFLYFQSFHDFPI